MSDDAANFMNFEVGFTDDTLLQTNGSFAETKKLMEKPQKLIGNIFVAPPSKNWVIKSTISIKHELGYAQVVCDFYDDGRVMIANYGSTSKDRHRPDIRCLSFWSQSVGWGRPEPIPALVDADLAFWRLQWETYIVESDYLTKKFGLRNHSYVDDIGENDVDSESEDDLEKEIRKL